MIASFNACLNCPLKQILPLRNFIDTFFNNHCLWSFYQGPFNFLTAIHSKRFYKILSSSSSSSICWFWKTCKQASPTWLGLTWLGLHSSYVTHIHMAGAHMFGAHKARDHMAGAHMVGASHFIHISRSQIKFILLLLL